MRLPALAVVLLALAALGPPPAASQQADESVSMAEYVFSPTTTRIYVGESIQWDNDGELPHTATGISGPEAFNTGVVHSDATSAPIVFDTAGIYAYQCNLHPDRMTGSIIVSVSPSDVPPTATFEWDAKGLSVSANASASSDPEGAIVDYRWSWGDGSKGGTGMLANHTYGQPGAYQVNLTVRDSAGQTSSASRLIGIASPSNNAPPIANFTVTVSDLTVNVNGGDSRDPDGAGIARWEWTWGDGSPRSGLTNATHTYPSPGVYVIQLIVRDYDGGEGTATREVTVVRTPPPNQLPRALFILDVDDLDVTGDATHSFDGDGTIVEHRWDWGDGTGDDGDRAIHRYAAPGNFTITLTVRDDRGAVVNLSREIRVGPVEAPPVAKLLLLAEGLTLTADASSSHDDDGRIVSYAWDFGDGSRIACDANGACTSQGPARSTRVGSGVGVAAHAYLRDGRYSVRLTLADDSGAVSTLDAVAVVAREPPMSFETVIDGPTVSLDARRIPTYANASYAWSADGNAIGRSSRLDHSFGVPGSHEVRLVLADDAGTLELSRTVVSSARSRAASTNDAASAEVPMSLLAPLAGIAVAALLRRRAR